MIAIKSKIKVSGIDVQIVRKGIKNLHLSVYPPNGNVRVSVPEHVTNDNVRMAVINKLGWIKRQQRDFENQPRQSKRKYVSGEGHYFLGRMYRFELIEHDGKHEIKMMRSGKIKMFVKPKTTIKKKEILLNTWYREQLKKMIPELLDKWQPIVKKKANDWGVKKMKTKWGSCNVEKKRVWLNLELAKKPKACLEYILVHELIHLHERHHNEHFKTLLDKFMPNWRTHRDTLNKSPLAHEEWAY